MNSQVEEQVEIQIEERFKCKLCSQVECKKCQKEIRSEKIGYSLFLIGSTAGAILSSVLLTYLTPGVFITSGLGLGVIMKSIYDLV